ncbi:DUF6503 family protein [Spongiimicrobium salis]|uniref:DUF6503 family protein n=1 Tax=Spongiimicrobium salis TaxID=1667022 RepID=UPI00374C9E2F
MIQKPYFTILVLLFLFSSCKGEKETSVSIENKKITTTPVPKYIEGDPQAILAAVEYHHGGWKNLLRKQDVEYHYEYRLPNGKADLSVERYLFKSEASFGHYSQHDINAFPEIEGAITQFFNGQTTIAMVDQEKILDKTKSARAEFLRRANYFWFVMPYKLNDKGTLARYLGKENYEGIAYDKIEITYDAAITGKALNDTYILYINPETILIDRFYFSLPAFGILTPTILAAYAYTEIEGQKLATHRTYFFRKPDGTYGASPDITQKLTQVTFHNGFTLENISKIP